MRGRGKSAARGELREPSSPLKVLEAAGSSSGKMTTALLTETMLDSLSSIVTLTVALAMASAVLFSKAELRPLMLVSKMVSGTRESLLRCERE